MAATRDEDLCHLPKFALEAFGRDLQLSLQPHAPVSDHCSRPTWLCFSLPSLKAGIRTIAIFHHFIMNLMIFYYFFLNFLSLKWFEGVGNTTFIKRKIKLWTKCWSRKTKNCSTNKQKQFNIFLKKSAAPRVIPWFTWSDSWFSSTVAGQTLKIAAYVGILILKSIQLLIRCWGAQRVFIFPAH